MKRKFKPPKAHRRKRSFSASDWAPILALAGTALGIIAVIVLVLYVALPKLLPLVGIDYRAPFVPTPPPTPTPIPTPTPHPMAYFDPVEDQIEVMFADYTEYRWFADPYFYEDKLIFSVGKMVDNNVLMTNLILYTPKTRVGEKLAYAPQNDHLLFPKMNAQWLVYFDAKLNGGGNVMASDISQGYGNPVLIKEVFTGQPELMLDGNYLTWIERTGSRMDKLFVCDLTTRETAAVQMFNGSVYGQSLPSLRDGLLVWADAGDVEDGEETTSTIYSIPITESTVSTYRPGTYVHDPEHYGGYMAWLDAHHSEDTRLYFTFERGEPMLIDEGVVEFGMGDGFVAYTKNETMWVYILDKKEAYRVTPEHEKALFLGVSDNKVIWMDVTSRERDIMKFAEIPHG